MLRFNIVEYNPDRLGEVDRFTYFWRTTYQFSFTQQLCLRGVQRHFHKIHYLKRIFNRIYPLISEEKKELDENGFTPLNISKEIAAIIESIFIELYSVIDCTRQVLFAIYGSKGGIPGKSTEKLFTNARSNRINNIVPAKIRESLKNVEWYNRLRDIRKNIIHYNIGSCYYDYKSNKLNYRIEGIKESITEDVITEIENYIQNVNKLLGNIFQSLNNSLNDEEVEIVCGFFNGGRVYQRYATAHDPCGRCKSIEWFEYNSKFICPYKDNCIAYQHIKAPNESASHLTPYK